jgi:DNA-directed RNA polymerase beta subunit
MSTDKSSPEDGAGMPAVEEEAEEELQDEGVVESKMKVRGGTLYIVATP